MTDSDPELSNFERAQRGEPVLDQLVAQHLPQLRAFVRTNMVREMRARESASDIVQTVCRALLAGREQFDFRGEAEFKGWLFTAARRKILERVRFHHRHQRDIRREDHAEDDLLDGYATVCTPSAILSAREQVERLETALDSLAEDDREVIALAQIADLPFAEVGAQMNRSAEAARKLLGRALVKLTSQLRQIESGNQG